MGSILGWAALAIKRKKPDSKMIEELETTTRLLDRDFVATNADRKCQEAIAKMYKMQLVALRKNIETHEKFSEELKTQERILQKKYENAKRELKLLDYKRLRVEQQCRASRQKLNELVVDIEDEKRNHAKNNTVVDNSWMTRTL